MAVRYLGSALTNGPKAPSRSEYVGAASGGTLAGSQKVQLVWDDATVTNDAAGKQMLMDALDAIHDHIASAKTWPVDSTS